MLLWVGALGWRLLANRAAAAPNALVLHNLAIKVILRLDNAAEVNPAVYAGVGALKAGVVRLYGVVVILGSWMRVGCARLFGVYSVFSLLWAGSRGAATPAGPLLYPTPSFYHF